MSSLAVSLIEIPKDNNFSDFFQSVNGDVSESGEQGKSEYVGGDEGDRKGGEVERSNDSSFEEWSISPQLHLA